jgi:hypothetical protein
MSEVDLFSTINFLWYKTSLCQLILKIDLVTVEGQQNSLLYQHIEIEAGIYIVDVGQHNILETLSRDNYLQPVLFKVSTEDH